MGPELRVVFVSRISAKKNLLSVLLALEKMSRPVDLTIAGPVDDEGYWVECMTVIRRLPSNIRVLAVGPIEVDLVRDLFSKSDIFAFPTKGENFGHVIAESLSASCPVICGTDTPWSDLLADGAGWLVDPNHVDDLVSILDLHAGAGPDGWMAASLRAAHAYEEWHRTRDNTNVFAILPDLIS